MPTKILSPRRVGGPRVTVKVGGLVPDELEETRESNRCGPDVVGRDPAFLLVRGGREPLESGVGCGWARTQCWRWELGELPPLVMIPESCALGIIPNAQWFKDY